MNTLVEAERSAKWCIDTRQPSDSILDIALDHLTIARIALYRALLDPAASLVLSLNRRCCGLSRNVGYGQRTFYNLSKLNIACLDLEGVLVPEIWINVAERTGIDALRATTRDVPDYDVLMRQRLDILATHKLGIADVQAVINDMGPMEGAYDFLLWLKERYQVVILSDTFYDFAAPLMKQLDYPTLFCHRLEIDDAGMIANYHLRMRDQKREAVKAFHGLNFKVAAAGDSYNDTTMLGEADSGILFCPPENVIAEFPQFPVTRNYEEMKAEFSKALEAFSTTNGH
jgi:phosphoserine/homoserine phosphotransferase